MNEIEKIKYHLSLLAESLDSKKYPIPSLVISYDWSEDDLSIAHDIFQKMDEELDAKEAPNWAQFEIDFKLKLDMNYQDLKIVVLSFFRNGQWVEVCSAYASKNQCVEFDEINKQAFSAFERYLSVLLDTAGVKYENNVKIESKNGPSAELDFVCLIKDKRVGVEAKVMLDGKIIPQLILQAKLAMRSGLINEFIIVTNALPLSIREELLKNDIQSYLPKEFERFVFESIGDGKS